MLTFCALLAFCAQARIAPPAPFPLITRSVFDSEFVAPGILYGTYSLDTSAGPLVVHAVAIDLHDPTVRLDTVLARDAIATPGETTSSMARRTGAVAGVNADYFALGSTNEPLGIVARDGVLLKTPSRRAALTVTREHDVRFGTYTLHGAVTDGREAIPLTGVDEWPPQGGASLILPQYGKPAPAPEVLFAKLAPLDATQSGRYRVVSVDSANAPPAATLALALGPAARGAAPAPNAGDLLTLAVATDPPLGDVSVAVGGGPLLVRDGASVEDPNSPAPDERDVRYPVVGAAKLHDGTLLLLEVDGRQPDFSVGLTRPEFAALMRGFGATGGIAFDSGGSATVVTRRLGDAAATIRNLPSDGDERPVADGLFAYSTAPQGPAAQLVVRPRDLRLLRGARAVLEIAAADANGHPRAPSAAPLETITPTGLATIGRDGSILAGNAVQSGSVALTSGALHATVPLAVVAQIAKITITPHPVAVPPGELVALGASGTTADGEPVQIGSAVRWTTSDGSIDKNGFWTAGTHDARITATAGGAAAAIDVAVGQSTFPLDVFTDSAARSAWRFATFPRGGGGALAHDPACRCLEISYDPRGAQRAAYARAAFELGGVPQAFSIDVRGDAGGELLRAGFTGGNGKPINLTLAKSIDWNGWRRMEIKFPATAIAPLTLDALYVVTVPGTPASHQPGTIALRDPNVTLAGSTRPAFVVKPIEAPAGAPP